MAAAGRGAYAIRALPELCRGIVSGRPVVLDSLLVLKAPARPGLFFGGHQRRDSRSWSIQATGDAPWRNPITGIVDCCARAASGHGAAAPPMSDMNLRLLTRSPRRRGQAKLSAHRGRLPWRLSG